MTTEDQIKQWREEFELLVRDGNENHHFNLPIFLDRNENRYLDKDAHGMWLSYLSACKRRQEELEIYKSAFGVADSKWQEILIKLEKRDKLLGQAKPWIEECILEGFTFSKECEQWLADYEELKNEAR